LAFAPPGFRLLRARRPGWRERLVALMAVRLETMPCSARNCTPRPKKRKKEKKEKKKKKKKKKRKKKKRKKKKGLFPVSRIFHWNL